MSCEQEQEKYIEELSRMTLKDLFNCPLTRSTVEPYMQEYIKRYNRKSDARSFNKIEWFSMLDIGGLDYDMCSNQGGGIYFEGWHEMIEKLVHLGPQYNPNYKGLK